MPYFTFLKKFKKYKSFTYNIFHPNILKNNFYTVCRIKLTLTRNIDEIDTKMIICFNKLKENYLKRFFEFYLVKNKSYEKEYYKKRVYLDQDFSLKSFGYEDSFYLIVTMNTKLNILENKVVDGYRNFDSAICRPGFYSPDFRSVNKIRPDLNRPILT